MPVDPTQDDDFDAYVADLILADARKAQAQQDRRPAGGSGSGLRRTYFDPSAAAGGVGESGPGPKPTNKRFLSNVIREVDAHNRTVIRQQRQAVDEANAKRRAFESRGNRVAASRTDESRGRVEHRGSTSRRSRSPSSRSSSESDLSRSNTPRSRRSQHESRPYDEPEASTSRKPQQVRGSGRSSAPELPEPGSKMDKYFDPSYDPALDVDIADLEDPTTGLIGELPDALFTDAENKGKSKQDGTDWANMLAVVKQHDADKARRRAERAERRARKADRAARREDKHDCRPEQHGSSRARSRHRSPSASPSPSRSASPPPRRRESSSHRRDRYRDGEKERDRERRDRDRKEDKEHRRRASRSSSSAERASRSKKDAEKEGGHRSRRD
ncbi:hypothetical protein V8E36_009814 [Tilletia maclaganii]